MAPSAGLCSQQLPLSVVSSAWRTRLESFASTISLRFPFACERSGAGQAQPLSSVAVMVEKADKRGFTANGGFFRIEKMVSVVYPPSYFIMMLDVFGLFTQLPC